MPQQILVLFSVFPLHLLDGHICVASVLLFSESTLGEGMFGTSQLRSTLARIFPASGNIYLGHWNNETPPHPLCSW